MGDETITGTVEQRLDVDGDVTFFSVVEAHLDDDRPLDERASDHHTDYMDAGEYAVVRLDEEDDE